MKISHRLFLGVIPSVVGLFTVAGLAYWGQYAHTAPQLVVWAAAAATILSLAVAWWNTSYVAHRVERADLVVVLLQPHAVGGAEPWQEGRAA